MKIHDIHRAGALRQYNRNAEVSGSKAGKAAPQRDELRISDEAKGLLEAGQARAERIQQLKHSIETGTYHVDARKIAEKLLPYLNIRQ